MCLAPESLGNGCQVIVDPVEVFRLALHKRVGGVILHSHPNDILEALEKDKVLTDRLIQAGRILKPPVLVHAILTKHSYYSFKGSGLLSPLGASLKYVPSYEIEA